MDPKLIASVPLFAGVGRRRQQRELAALVDEVTVPAGTKLTREGGYATEFFVILEGQADVTALHTAPAKISAGSAKLGTLGPGDFFGEVGLLAGPKRSATVVAASPMRLLAASSRDFSTLMRSFPMVAARVRAECAARTGAFA
ncbi:MAG TPA: cyclic nucleotide-binding domain-containing protein [Gaiella sp.]|jgi:CRP-like cAMP-binding protein